MVDFRVASKAFIVNNDKLLILKRSSTDVQKPGAWELPGGRLEVGEDPIVGLKREIQEEAGIDVDVVHPMNIRHFTRKDGQIITMLVYLCKANTDEITLSHEHSDFEWIPLEKSKDKVTDFFHKEIDLFSKFKNFLD